MFEPVTISVVICAHWSERLDLLRDALRSIETQSRAAHEIIAVIDHNGPLLDVIARKFPAVRAIANSRTRGLSGARNTGIAAATGEVVAFIDDDARADHEWLARLGTHYDDQRVMAVGGRIDPVWPGMRPTWFPHEFDWVIGCSYLGQPEGVAEVRNLIGCNMSFRRGVFERAGLFPEGIGREADNAAGCEETELCIRAARALPNSVIVLDATAAVTHIIAPHRTSLRYFLTRCRAEGLSKAQVVERTGAGLGLASERRYATRVLPAGVLRGLADTLFRFDRGGLARAAAIVLGFGYVAASYLAARLPRRHSVNAYPAGPFAPVQVLDIDLAEQTAPIPSRRADGAPLGGIFALVRQAGRPAGVAEFPLYGEDISSDRARHLYQTAEQPSSPPIAVELSTLPFVRVVIATRERPETLAKCLDSIAASEYPCFEIVVVDNAPSTDATRQLIASRAATDRRLGYVREDRPGLGHAHNRGIAGATAAIIAFTDDDVVVDRHWLRAIAANFAADPRIGCVTGLILPVELETRAQFWTERHGSFGKGFVRRLFDLAENRPDSMLFPYAAGAFGSGANMAFRLDSLLAIGGFDSALGAGTIAKGGDDLAAFSSVIKAGFRLAYEPGALVWHLHRRNEEGMRRQAYGYGVGLGAYLTKTLLDDPPAVFHFARALPTAAAHLLGSRSSKNRRLPADYPRGLRWKERIGIVAGVPAYLRSRASYRRYVRSLQAPPPSSVTRTMMGSQP